jgi:hypothetical protein
VQTVVPFARCRIVGIPASSAKWAVWLAPIRAVPNERQADIRTPADHLGITTKSLLARDSPSPLGAALFVHRSESKTSQVARTYLNCCRAV